MYTIELAGGFREYDCTVTYGFDGSHKIENSKLRDTRKSSSSSRSSLDSMLKDKSGKKDELLASLHSKGKRVFGNAISHQ